MEKRKFYLKIAIFNSLGFLVALGIPIIFDPIFATHVQFGHRSYPNGPYFLLFAPLVFVVTLYLMEKAVDSLPKFLYFFSWAPLLIGVPILWVFQPELPHMGIISTLFGTGILSFLTTWIHFPHKDQKLEHENNFLSRIDIPLAVKVERLKDSISMWNGISIYGAAGYLAFSIAWASQVSKAGELMLSSPEERFIFSNVFIGEILLFSIGVIIGPLKESFNRTLELKNLFTEIKDVTVSNT